MNVITSADRRAEDRRNAERRIVERRLSADRRTVERREAPATALATVTPIRHLHRDRDFGVGYGNSSGYASQGRYAPTWNQTHFRVA